jgi:hypothetical protein
MKQIWNERKKKRKENIKRKKATGRLTGPAPEEAHGPTGQETRIGTLPSLPPADVWDPQVSFLFLLARRPSRARSPLLRPIAPEPQTLTPYAHQDPL